MFLSVTPGIRQALGDAIESLVALFDEIEGDENLEDGGDQENTLGWTAAGPGGSANYEGEAEPSLGWTAGGALGGTDDREDEHDGREPDEDREPNGDERDWSDGIEDEPIFRGYTNDRPAAGQALQQARALARRIGRRT